MAPELAVTRLSSAHIPSNVALSNSVGWPDSDAEWRVIHEAALVLGVWRDGLLIGQGALGMFDGAATVAKMVVANEARGQGIGGAILDALLAEARQRTLAVVGLVATPLGRPLYEKRGFRELGEIVILMGTPSPPSDEASQSTTVHDVEQCLALEARYSACSRAAMLRGRLNDASATALSESGYALATPHERGARVGPLVAADEPGARALATAIFGSIRGPVRLDVPGEQTAFRAWLRSIGLIEKGVHAEMALGGTPPWRTNARFGLATQAWG